jgi:hypothetical protein
MLVRLLATAALSLVAAAAAAAPSSAASRPCSDGDRFLQQLRVSGTGCEAGREVMFAWARSSDCIRGGDGLLAERVRRCRLGAFRCVPRDAEGGVRVRCTRGERVRVRFFDSQG